MNKEHIKVGAIILGAIILGAIIFLAVAVWFDKQEEPQPQPEAPKMTSSTDYALIGEQVVNALKQTQCPTVRTENGYLWLGNQALGTYEQVIQSMQQLITIRDMATSTPVSE